MRTLKTVFILFLFTALAGIQAYACSAHGSNSETQTEAKPAQG